MAITMLNLDLVGTTPLLMCNSRLADPLNANAQAMKAIYSKGKNKTLEDYEEIGHVEFAGALYHDEELGPYVPGDNIWRMIYDAATKQRKGPKVKAGLKVMDEVNPLQYEGPRKVEELWNDKQFEFRRIAKPPGQGRVVRTRPIFKKWSVKGIRISLDTKILDLEFVEQFVETGGELIGLGDWRPRYGRFTGTLTVTKVLS